MNLHKHIPNNFLKIKAIPNSQTTKLVEKDNHLILYLKSPPEKDKANLELIKFFKKEFGLRVEIKSGKRSRNKVIEIRKKKKN